MSKSNKALVPEAKEALNQFKMEAASEVGVIIHQNSKKQTRKIKKQPFPSSALRSHR